MSEAIKNFRNQAPPAKTPARGRGRPKKARRDVDPVHSPTTADTEPINDEKDWQTEVK